jgi:hypothetical protein
MYDDFLPDFPSWLICPTRNRLLLLRLFLAQRLADTSVALVHVVGRNGPAFYRLTAQCAAWRELIKTVKDDLAFHRLQHHC